jgi:aspartyl-tRNA(Asn)/glutamyl-tRNA(Gln) amidotransferase subunit C
MTRPDVDVEALAKLARLEVSPEELSRLEKEIPEILAFVETIQAVSGEVAPESSEVRNMMREDAGAHESGEHTETLLSAAPAAKDGYLVVKKVLSRPQ